MKVLKGKTRSSEPVFFSPGWWQSFLTSWNASEHRKSFAKLGTVRFEIEDQPFDPVCVEWDDEGFANLVPCGGIEPTTFSATRNGWRDFLNGKKKASSALLSGEIKHTGKLGTILPYSLSFNHLQEVTSEID